MCAEISKATRSDVGGELFCYVAIFWNDDRCRYRNPLLALKEAESEPDTLLALKEAESEPDTLYNQQAMKKEDREKFKESMAKEVTDQLNNGNFTIIPNSEVPKGQTILPVIWQMKRKRNARD